MRTYPSAQTLGFLDVKLRVPGLEALTNLIYPPAGRRAGRLEGEDENQKRPKTKPAPSTQLRKAVLGGAPKKSGFEREES